MDHPQNPTIYLGLAASNENHSEYLLVLEQKITRRTKRRRDEKSSASTPYLKEGEICVFWCWGVNRIGQAQEKIKPI